MYKLQFKDNPERSIWLVGEKLSLGCGAGNDVVLDGLGIAELHAEILISADHLLLQSDAGSCFVNELPVDAEHSLQANDELRIGKERLVIVDPQQIFESPSVIKPVVNASTGWSLIPDHPKLRQSDFLIAARSVIGRSKSCEFAVPYKLLSREHAELTVEGGELMLKDLNSSNGCFVNGTQVEQATLKEGDKVHFSKLAFTVEGPESKSLAKKAMAREKLNATLVRPAINIDEGMHENQALADEGGIPAYPELGVEAVAAVSQPSGVGRWLLMGLLVAALTVAAFLFVPWRL